MARSVRFRANCVATPTTSVLHQTSSAKGKRPTPAASPTLERSKFSANSRDECPDQSRLIHADGRFASYSWLKRESFPVVARDESKQPVDKLRRRRFTQRVTHVPRQGIEFVRC